MELIVFLAILLLLRWGVSRHIDLLVAADFDRLVLTLEGVSIRGLHATAVLKAQHAYPHKDLFLPMPSCDVSCLAVTPEGVWFEYLGQVRGLKLSESRVVLVSAAAAQARLAKHRALYRFYFDDNETSVCKSSRPTSSRGINKAR